MSGKQYTEKEKREAIIDCAGSYHPAVGGKYLPWNPWLHIRKTYTDEIDRLERELAKEIQQRKELAKKFTRLDKPKHSGDPMLDAVLGTRNSDFDAWVARLPVTYWVRYDLSAARIGWEAFVALKESQP